MKRYIIIAVALLSIAVMVGYSCNSVAVNPGWFHAWTISTRGEQSQHAGVRLGFSDAYDTVGICSATDYFMLFDNTSTPQTIHYHAAAPVTVLTDICYVNYTTGFWCSVGNQRDGSTDYLNIYNISTDTQSYEEILGDEYFDFTLVVSTTQFKDLCDMPDDLIVVGYGEGFIYIAGYSFENGWEQLGRQEIGYGSVPIDVCAFPVWGDGYYTLTLNIDCGGVLCYWDYYNNYWIVDDTFLYLGCCYENSKVVNLVSNDDELSAIVDIYDDDYNLLSDDIYDIGVPYDADYYFWDVNVDNLNHLFISSNCWGDYMQFYDITNELSYHIAMDSFFPVGHLYPVKWIYCMTDFMQYDRIAIMDYLLDNPSVYSQSDEPSPANLNDLYGLVFAWDDHPGETNRTHDDNETQQEPIWFHNLKTTLEESCCWVWVIIAGTVAVLLVLILRNPPRGRRK